jgi:hypothetical protein
MAENSQIVSTSVKAGISFGSCLAMIISYTAWNEEPRGKPQGSSLERKFIKLAGMPPPSNQYFGQ